MLRTNYLDYSYPTDRTAGWGRVAPRIEVYDLPGSHISCLNEHLGEMAKQIAVRLDEDYSDAEPALPVCKVA